MHSFEDLATTALAELDRCRAALRTASDWTVESPCTDWSLHDLTSHLAAVAWQQGEAFGRARIGVAETPSYLEVGGDGPFAVDVLDLAVAQLRDHVPAVGKLGPDTLVPLGAGTFPAQIAAAILVFEHGIHRNDVDRALGSTDAVDLDPVVAATVMELLPLGMLARLAHPADAGDVTPLAYRLVGDSADAGLAWTGDAWSPSPDALAGATTCTFSGSDAAVVQLALGRIPIDHPAITLDDPVGIAPSFRRHFHGL